MASSPCPVHARSYFQWIDARDLANFVVRVGEDKLTGVFHTTGPSVGQGFIETIEQIVAQVAPKDSTLREISVENLAETGLARKLPLWSPNIETVMALDSSRALEQGLDLRPLEDSVEDVASWWGDRSWPEQWLTSDEEARLLEL